MLIALSETILVYYVQFLLLPRFCKFPGCLGLNVVCVRAC